MAVVSLCCTCPEVTLGGRYPLSLPCGARTFLIRGLSACVRGCPTWSRKYCTPTDAKCQISLQILLENDILYKEKYGKLSFSGQCPQIMRARCVSILYFPDLLGNATCSKTDQLLSCIEPGEPNGVTITARAQARIVSGGAPRSESNCK